MRSSYNAKAGRKAPASDERCCYCYEGVDHTKAQHDEALWYLTPSGRRAMEKFFDAVRERRLARERRQTESAR